MQRIIKHTINSDTVIRDFLKNSYSYRRIYNLKESGKILLNGTLVTASERAKAGDELTLVFEENLTFNYTAKDVGLKIIYEDEDLIVVYKPQGVTSMPVNPQRGNDLFNGLAYLRPGLVFRVVTRLDKNTSGLVLLAKNALTHSILYEKMPWIKKEYVALVSGKINAPLKINAPILSNGEKRRVVDKTGKPAETIVVSSKPVGDNFSLVTVQLKTGRTHQIRVHLSHVGHPIVGDELYGGMGSGGQALVCNKLEFLHPITKKKISITINGEEEILQRI